MPNLDLFPSQSGSVKSPSLAPPDIIARAGQHAVAAYAKLHVIFASAQNDQFAVGVTDFLDWLENLAPGISLEHIVEDNITSHLANLSDIGCSETEQSSRLCAIDLFLTEMSGEIPELARIPRSGYGRPCPPLLIVENSSEKTNFIGVYIDFLMSHTNQKTREVYAQGLRRFCDWIVNNSKTAEVPNISKLTGSQMAAFIASISESDEETGLTDDKARTCLLYTSPSPRDGLLSRMPSSA